MVLDLGASALPLGGRMHVLRPWPRPPRSETRAVSSWLWCSLKFESHWFQLRFPAWILSTWGDFLGSHVSRHFSFFPLNSSGLALCPDFRWTLVPSWDSHLPVRLQPRQLLSLYTGPAFIPRPFWQVPESGMESAGPLGACSDNIPLGQFHNLATHEVLPAGHENTG